MAWTLQPRSYMQAIRPNFYSVAYKRNGAYKGMGWLGQAVVQGDQAPITASTTPVTGGICPGAPGCPEFQTAPCPGTPGCPGYTDPYQNLKTLIEGVLAGENSLISTGALTQLTRASVTQPSATTPKWVIPVFAAIAIYFALTGGRR